MAERARVPVWLIGLIWTLVGALISGGVVGGIAYGKAVSDVTNLKEEVNGLKPLAAAMVAVQTDLNTLKSNSAEMKLDIKSLLQRVR